MKKTSIIISVLLVALLMSSCKDEEPAPEVAGEPVAEQDAAVTTPSPAPAAATPAPAVLPTAEVAEVVALQVTDDVSGNSLYAAVAFKNTCDQPIVISKADVTFSFGEKEKTSFVPMVYKDDVIQPGELAHLAVWVPYDKKVSEPITATCELTPELASTQVTKKLDVSDVFLTQNYPEFATVSGMLTNNTQSDFSLSVVYLSFYDDQSQLLGTWHFTKNLSIPVGESRNFVMHMQSLRIDDLAARTTSVQARAIGIT